MTEQIRNEKLKKLLPLTASTNDHEALSAIRKANDILKDSGISWPQVFGEETERELAVLKGNLNQLHQAYNLLAHKYNALISQLVFTQPRPQTRMPRRRRL